MDLINPLDELGKYSRVALIHHWDADGVSSAALLIKSLRELGVKVRNYVPRLGMYSAEAIDLGIIEEFSPDVLALVDYGLSLSEVVKLVRSSRVVVVDHHRTYLRESEGVRVINPLALGLGDEVSYPSTTWVIKESAGREVNWLVVLGVAGDVEVGIRGRVKEEVGRYLSEAMLRYEDFVELARAVNAVYMSFKNDLVAAIPWEFTDSYSNPLKVLREGPWWEAYREVREEVSTKVREVSKSCRDVGELIKVCYLRSRYYIASQVGRELARRWSGKVVVLVAEVEGVRELSRVYVRSARFRVGKCVNYLRERGYIVGGKDFVFSIQVGGGDLNVVEDIIKCLKGINWGD